MAKQAYIVWFTAKEALLYKFTNGALDYNTIVVVLLKNM